MNAVHAQVAETPCLQALKEQQASPAASPKKKTSSGTKIFGRGGIFEDVTRAAGIDVRTAVCGSNQLCRNQGAKLINELAPAIQKMIDEDSKKRIANASYTAALTGQPASLALDGGCAVVEPLGAVDIEEREVVISFLGGVAPPTETLKTIAEWQAPAASTPVAATSTPAKRARATLAAGKPVFVMGSVKNGSQFLVADMNGDEMQIGVGYAAAKGWQRLPDQSRAIELATPNDQIAEVASVTLLSLIHI
jgi:hypothetical protein